MSSAVSADLFLCLWGRPRPMGGGNLVCMAKQQPLIGATKNKQPGPTNEQQQPVMLSLTVVVVSVHNNRLLC